MDYQALLTAAIARKAPKKAPVRPQKRTQLPERLVARMGTSLLASLDHYSAHTKRSYRTGLVSFSQWLAQQDAIDLPPAPDHAARGTKQLRIQQAAWEDLVVALGGAYLLGLEAHEASQITEAYLRDLLYESKTITPATGRLRLAALRWAVREAYRMGQVKWLLAAKFPRPRKDPEGRIVEKAGRNMKGPTPDQAARLMKASQQIGDPRAHAILSLLRYEGYREHEVRQLNLGDVDLDAAAPTATMVRKKRGEPQAYPLSAMTRAALLGWLKVRGKTEGPLFTGGRNGMLRSRRIGQSVIGKIVVQVAKKAGINEMSPHRIRHRALTDIVRSGLERKLAEEDLLFLAGHSSRAELHRYFEASKSRKNARDVLNAIGTLVDEDDA